MPCGTSGRSQRRRRHFLSHLFTLLWTADVLSWWLAPSHYAVRSPWFDRLLHGVMLFVIFNGTVVYETGFIRWAGVAFVRLGAMAYRRAAAPCVIPALAVSRHRVA